MAEHFRTATPVLAVMVIAVASGCSLGGSDAPTASVPAPSSSAGGNTADAGGEASPTLWEDLQDGGNVIFIRHAEAGSSEAEGNSAECGGPELSLNDLGREQVQDIEAGISALQLPVSSVTTSAACRTLVTADAVLAGISDRPTTFQDERVADGEGLRDLLTTPAPDGGNTVIVGHSSPFEDATGLSSGARGTTVVLEIRDGEVLEIGRLTPEQWRSYADSQ